MRITIDATPLLLRSAGVKNYVYYWLVALRRLAGEAAVRTFPVPVRLGELNHEGSLASGPATLAGLVRLHASNYLRLPADWWSAPGDVFHASQQLWNPPRRTAFTATLYDVTCWLMPEAHTAANVAAARRFAQRVLRRAARLIAISENTRADAVRLLGLPAEKIEVIYPGVAEAFFQVRPEAVELLKARYRLERPYVLFVGAIEPRKNLARLLEAWQSLPASLREEFELVLAGPPGWGDPSLLHRLRTAGSGAHYLGYVPEKDLPALTAGAALFVYPSLYEGFGFPVAQAMAAGTPVLTSAISSLPEVVGEAGELTDPYSVREIGAAIERLLASPARRAELGARGARRARRFRWEECARQSWQFFERAAGGA
jgi:glycosyltransferase involved in cell wall biosynthesis